MTGSASAIAPDGIPPGEIVQRTLRTGATMPGIGLGTFGSDRFSHEDVAAAVRGAIAVGSPTRPDRDMQALARIDRNSRLIKGHVFLWKDDQDWRDLWDIDGEITPP